MERFKRNVNNTDLNESHNITKRILYEKSTKRLKKSYKLSDDIGQRVITVEMNKNDTSRSGQVFWFRKVRPTQIDRQRLITASSDQTLKLWNWKTKKCLRTLHGHTSQILSLTLLRPYANTCASLGDEGQIKVWNLETFQCILTLQSNGSAKCMLYVSRTHQLLSGDNGCIRVWNLMNGECVREIFAHNWIVLNLVSLIHLDEKTNDFKFISNDFNTIKVWSLDTCQCLYTHVDGVEKSIFNCLIALPGNSMFRELSSQARFEYVATGSDDGLIRVWDITLKKNKCMRRLKIGRDRSPITCLVYLETTKELVSATSFNVYTSVRLWNVMRGECVKSLVAGECASLYIIPNTGQLVTGCLDGSLKVWLLRSNLTKQRKTNDFMLPHHQNYTIKEHERGVNCVELFFKELNVINKNNKNNSNNDDNDNEDDNFVIVIE